MRRFNSGSDGKYIFSGFWGATVALRAQDGTDSGPPFHTHSSYAANIGRMMAGELCE
jgi:hypothetical protein